MARYHGKGGVVYVSTSGSGNAVAVISLNSWELNMATDKVEVTAFGDKNKVYVQGLKDISGTISGFWDSADDTLFDAADSADGVKIYLYPSENAMGIYWYGPAWLDVSISTGVSAAVTVSCNISANGSWGRQTS